LDGAVHATAILYTPFEGVMQATLFAAISIVLLQGERTASKKKVRKKKKKKKKKKKLA
jgi:membrane protein implicated in regulation of membrane protease activity